MLKINSYQKKYPGNTHPVLVIDEFKINKGVYWIKGENGSGKTSLLKSIAGLIPFDGNIFVNDLHIHKSRMAYTKIVSYAEAEPKYPPFLTGKELINFYIALKGPNYPTDLFNNLGVAKFLEDKVSTYSSGMLKKLSIVLAFIGSPSLILLDEPLVALDVVSVEVLQSAIVAYNQRGVSFITTSHQPFNNEVLSVTHTFLVKDKSLLAATI